MLVQNLQLVVWQFMFPIDSNMNYGLISITYLTGTECLSLNTYESNSKRKFTVGVVYWHPNQSKINEFMDCFSNSLSDLSKSKNVYYILGDFNINIHPDSRTTYANDYINLLLSHGAFPIITKPTIVTENSATIIDHIISNDIINVLNPGIIRADLTDHYPIFCCVKRFYRKDKTKKPKMYSKDKSSFCAEHFCVDLGNNLNEFFFAQPALSIENFNKLFNRFAHIILSTIDTHAPIESLTRKEKKLKSKPWITKGIFISIKKKQNVQISFYKWQPK